jgi:putative oxidoreductase
MGFKLLGGIGRFLVSLIFLGLAAISILNWEISQAELASALANWELYTGYIEGASFVIQNLLTVVPLLLVIGIVLQVVGGFLLCLSIKVRLGAVLLLVQLIFATTLYYHFWFLDGPGMQRAMILFLKNLSIIGSLLVIISLGQGESSSGSSKGKSSN